MKIGIVDDDPSVLDLLEDQLEFMDLKLTSNPEEAIQWINQATIDCLVSDLKLGDLSGMDLLKRCQSADAHIEVIIMTGYGSVDTAVEAMKQGARDYLQKPVDVEELSLILGRVEEELDTRNQLEGFRAARESEHESLLIGDSTAMNALRDRIEKVAAEPINVLIQGETGTGKELVAQEIHRSSPRSEAPLITVNCAAIPENLLESELFGYVKGAFTGADRTKKGKIELADGGTIFLDEIGEMPPGLQPKLLRVIEQERLTRLGGESSRSVDVRFVSATNRNLNEMLESDTFRKDLYYRLQTIELKTPPLRDHPEDIPRLFQHFLSSMAGERFSNLEPSSAVIDLLKTYDWPGNVRELRNIVERSAVLAEGNQISVSDLPHELQESEHTVPTSLNNWREFGESLQDILQAIEQQIIEEVLEETGGNKAEAARRLGISRQNLHYKLND